MAKSWFDEKNATPREQQLFEEEHVVLVATEEILRLMEKEGITKAQLAKTLGKSKAYVTQALAGGRNMTLRTLAAFAWACGHSMRGFDFQRFDALTVTLEAEMPRSRLRWPDLRLVKSGPSAGAPAQELELAA
jgi:transcriptional regulator with XRE-family HTH domain